MTDNNIVWEPFCDDINIATEVDGSLKSIESIKNDYMVTGIDDTSITISPGSFFSDSSINPISKSTIVLAAGLIIGAPVSGLAGSIEAPAGKSVAE